MYKGQLNVKMILQWGYILRNVICRQSLTMAATTCQDHPSTSTSLQPPSITDDTATLVHMPILNLIFKTENNKVLYKINVQVKTTWLI